MYSLKTLVMMSFVLLLMSNDVYTQKIPFEGNRKVTIDNPYKDSNIVTIYFQAQSYSTSKAKGHGSYARLLGGNGYFIELADHAGKLALYTGSAWWDTEVDIRSGLQDIFLEFENGALRVFQGTNLIMEKRHRSSTFGTSNLHVGSTYNRGEHFDGVINYFCMYDRLLTIEEKETAIANRDFFADTFPTHIYDFLKGYLKRWVDGRFAIDEISSDIGLVSKDDLPATMRDGSVKVERIEMDQGGPGKYDNVQMDPPMPVQEQTNDLPRLDLKLLRQGDNSDTYKGMIEYNTTPMDAGVYSLIVDKRGNVVLKLIQKEK